MYCYKNSLEEIIETMLFDILKNYPDVCKCDKCISDMLALTLNCLTPKYVVSEQGKIYVRVLNEIDVQEKIKITTCIIKAIDKVHTCPKHDIPTST